jgi:hypothetical protein
MVLHTEAASARLGRPAAIVERGTVEAKKYSFVRRWSWRCGCSGEIIADTLIELHCCSKHR